MLYDMQEMKVAQLIRYRTLLMIFLALSLFLNLTQSSVIAYLLNQTRTTTLVSEESSPNIITKDFSRARSTLSLHNNPKDRTGEYLSWILKSVGLHPSAVIPAARR